MKLAEKSLDLDPSNPYAMNAKACAFAASSDFKSAIEWQLKALENPEFEVSEAFDGGTYADERLEKWAKEEMWFLP